MGSMLGDARHEVNRARPLSGSPGRGADRSGRDADGPDRGTDALDHDGNASNCLPDDFGRGTNGSVPVENASKRDVDTSERPGDDLDCDADRNVSDRGLPEASNMTREQQRALGVEVIPFPPSPSRVEGEGLLTIDIIFNKQ